MAWAMSWKHSAKIQILEKKLQHMTHLLNLGDKMCKYEIDPRSIVEDTEQTQLCSQMEGQSETSKAHLSTSLKQGVYQCCNAIHTRRIKYINNTHKID